MLLTTRITCDNQKARTFLITKSSRHLNLVTITKNVEMTTGKRSTMPSSRSSIVEDSSLLNSEPQPEKDSPLLIRILDIPQSLFQRSEDPSTTSVPAEVPEEEEEFKDDVSPTQQQDETLTASPSMYWAGELADEVLTMIENDREDEILLARMLQMPSSVFGVSEYPPLITNQRQFNFSSSAQDETNESRSSENWLVGVLDEVLAILSDDIDEESSTL